MSFCVHGEGFDEMEWTTNDGLITMSSFPPSGEVPLKMVGDTFRVQARVTGRVALTDSKLPEMRSQQNRCTELGLASRGVKATLLQRIHWTEVLSTCQAQKDNEVRTPVASWAGAAFCELRHQFLAVLVIGSRDRVQLDKVVLDVGCVPVSLSPLRPANHPQRFLFKLLVKHVASNMFILFTSAGGEISN